jgi:hypothetical protein
MQVARPNNCTAFSTTLSSTQLCNGWQWRTALFVFNCHCKISNVYSSKMCSAVFNNSHIPEGRKLVNKHNLFVCIFNMIVHFSQVFLKFYYCSLHKCLHFFILSKQIKLKQINNREKLYILMWKMLRLLNLYLWGIKILIFQLNSQHTLTNEVSFNPRLAKNTNCIWWSSCNLLVLGYSNTEEVLKIHVITQ